MRKYQVKGTVYVYDKATGKMVEKNPEPIEGDPASGENDEMKRGEDLDLNLSHSHGPWHTFEEMRAIADAIYPKTVDELQKAFLEEAKWLEANAEHVERGQLSADNKKEE